MTAGQDNGKTTARRGPAVAQGVFVTFEGGEGSGKSTHVGRLATRLEAAGLAVLSTREPGGTPGAESIRSLLVDGDPDRWDAMTETLLHFAARRDHVAKKIRPALDRGDWVLCDRFADSTVAYQGYGHGLGAEIVKSFYRPVVGDLVPDLTLILDVPVAEGLARAKSRKSGGTRYERMAVDFHERLRTGFLEIAAAEPGRCAVIDATAPVGAVTAEIARTVEQRLGVALPEPV